MHPIEQQSRFNAVTRDRWNYYESHRRQVTDMLLAIGKQRQRAPCSLAILGAGNGNDLDLQSFAACFSAIHLFDCDSDAMSRLKDRQLVDPFLESKVIIESPTDLSGIGNDLSQLPEPVTESLALPLAEKARTASNVLPGKSFDVVVSCCMMTQLLSAAVEAFGDESPFKHLMMLALRDGHLKLMSELLAPGGTGLLITDFVSSDTLPELNTAETAEDVLKLSRVAIDSKNFFTGANPWAIKKALSNLLEELPFQPWEVKQPWRWQIGESRSYLVTAIQFSKPESLPGFQVGD